MAGTVSGPNVWLVLLGVATAVDGLLAGASVDQSIKQLPARHRIGMRAFSAYSTASDQANGLYLYPPLGVGGAVLTIAAAIWALALHLPTWHLIPVLAAGVLSVAHSITTARAAPINWSQRTVENEEAPLAQIFLRFARWQAARAVLQVATFLVMVWALALNGGG
jgi:hypothetical protein